MPGEAGSGRCLRGAFGMGSNYHLGFGHGPFHAGEHIYIYKYIPFPSYQHVLYFPTTPNVFLEAVCAAEQAVQPQMNSHWLLVEGQKCLAGFPRRNCHSATDFST